MLDINDNNNNDEDWSMFSLTDNLTNSYVDQSKLLSYNMNTRQSEVGMQNFRKPPSHLLHNRVAVVKPLNITATQQSSIKQNNSLLFSYGSSPTSLQNHLQNQSTSPCSQACLRWRKAAQKVKFLNDPWAEFKLESYEPVRAVRHRYNAIKKQWVQDACTVKLEPKRFACGAMRACFRLKKLSNFVHKDSWDHASNYVAKSYMDTTVGTRERYFDDVKLQMEAKLWAEVFNRCKPPKQIDMFQVSVLELKSGDLYHLEHFIDGNYVKYNSNSGFVDETATNMRNTPQAFSHFTFECSQHELMVVDVQGVGDLYTDPQIHTAKGTDYGDGNLGIKGFALFFSTHQCNDVCKSLGLTPFDLAPSEQKHHEKKWSGLNPSVKLHLTQMRPSSSSSSSTSNGNEFETLVSPIPSTNTINYYMSQRSRRRSDTSGCSDDYNSSANDLPDISESEGYESSSASPQLSPANFNFSTNSTNNNNNNKTKPIPIQVKQPIAIPAARNRTESSCLDSAFSINEAMDFFSSQRLAKLRPSCVFAEKDFLSAAFFHAQSDRDHHEVFLRTSCSGRRGSDINGVMDKRDSVLGLIHLELCKYHEMGRFATEEMLSSSEDETKFDMLGAFFHLRQAANLGIDEAVVNMAKIHLQLPHDILGSFQVDPTEINRSIGFDYMLESADNYKIANRYAMFYVAQAYDQEYKDWPRAYEYYQKLVNLFESSESEESVTLTEETQSGADSEPIYLILARMAEMNMKGGHGLEKDLSEAGQLYSDAADKATMFGKGRLANKYYMLSEEAYSMAENED